MITKPTYWTRWRVNKMLKMFLAELEAEKNIKTQTLTMKEMFVRHRIHHETYRRWGEDYGDDEEICASVLLIKDIFESRIVTLGLRKDLDPWLSQFILKNNYGYKDDPGASQRDEQRLEIEMAETRGRLARQRRDNLLDGNSTDPKAV